MKYNSLLISEPLAIWSINWIYKFARIQEYITIWNLLEKQFHEYLDMNCIASHVSWYVLYRGHDTVSLHPLQ